jgi:hypothetical protein
MPSKILQQLDLSMAAPQKALVEESGLSGVTPKGRKSSLARAS